MPRPACDIAIRRQCLYAGETLSSSPVSDGVVRCKSGGPETQHSNSAQGSAQGSAQDAQSVFESAHRHKLERSGPLYQGWTLPWFDDIKDLRRAFSIQAQSAQQAPRPAMRHETDPGSPAQNPMDRYGALRLCCAARVLSEHAGPFP